MSLQYSAILACCFGLRGEMRRRAGDAREPQQGCTVPVTDRRRSSPFIFLNSCLQFPLVWVRMPQAGGGRRLFHRGHRWRGQQVTCLSLDA